MSEKPLDCVGVDAEKTGIGKSDFIPCPERPIVYGVGAPPVIEITLRRRTPEVRE